MQTFHTKVNIISATEVQFKFFDQLIVSAHIKAEISLLVDVHSHIIHKMKLCIIAMHTLFALVVMRLPGVIFQSMRA